MPESARRSTRQRKKNTRYSNDAFSELNAVLSSPELNPADPDPSLLQQDNINEELDEAFVQAEGEDGNEAFDDDPGSAVSADSDHDELDPHTLDDGPFPKSKRKAKKRQSAVDDLHDRGLSSTVRGEKKDVSTADIAGGDPHILNFLDAEKSKWLSLVSLPRRKSSTDGTGGMQHPYVYTSELQEAEYLKYQAWYKDQRGSEIMQAMQRSEYLDSVAGSTYLPSDAQSQSVHLGPYAKQKLYELQPLECLNVEEAWQSIEAIADSNGPDNQKRSRNGWILNLGSRILWMDWAPVRSGDTQYLAIATATESLWNDVRYSAFVPSPPYKASIQIWAFKSRDGGGEKVMDLSQEPRLVQVVCTNWGTCRRVHWCPVAMYAAQDDQETQHVGLLAGIWTDGYLRVLDIKIDPKGLEPYVKYHGAAFESRPPDTVCTCASWPSATQIAAGCANGYVAVWNVAKCILGQRTGHIAIIPASNMDPHPSMPPKSYNPTFYHCIHMSYVLAITGHHPFPSHYVTTASADGRVRLTSLRRPQTDFVVSMRSRNFPSFVTYSPHILSIITADENDGLRATGLRQSFASHAVARSPAQIVCVDAGKTHPCLLIGSADGSVIIVNILRRMFMRRYVSRQAEAWQQTWFRHEWVSKSSPLRLPAIPNKESLAGSPLEEALDDEDESSFTGEEEATHRTRSGNCRFLESFKLQPAISAKGPASTKSSSKKGSKSSQSQVDDRAGGPSITIYEEEQAVTCVVWNPNPETGGWAAAGMANGLIRVEDLSI